MLIALLLTAAAPETAEQLMADARLATAVAVRCPTEATPGEVVVCGRRRADRYRLPLTGGDGSTARDPGTAQRVAMTRAPSPCSQGGPFLIGCGHAGVGVSVTSDGRSRVLTPRELSP